ncbi:MAG: methylmalonyl Co-A mutase-associated GTPase MeaB [Candidatus Bathyarchaeia archaeon]
MSPSTQIQQLVKGVLKGDKRSIARTISIIENNEKEARRLAALLYPKTGKAHVLGITGPPGAGKSTLIEKLVKELRNRGKTVGVVAVDPTSPFTGGAFLGDRVRMQDLSVDPGVYIRSMATRNYPGALARATKDASRVLDASGKDVVIVETVGAGQSEVEVVKVVHTVIVVLAPGLGDDIQAIKAGQMEIGDIFVVNKADRENANKAVSDIEAMLGMATETTGWKPLVMKTSAFTGEGIAQLLEVIDQHRAYLKTGVLDERQKERVEDELIEALKEKITKSILSDSRSRGEWRKFTQKILARQTDPYTAADELLAKHLKPRTKKVNRKE